MTNTHKLKIFKAQVENVKKLDSSFDALMRSINICLRDNNMSSAESHTLLAALVFTALSEAQFSKLIHTPHAFELHEIEEIKRQRTISMKWKKAARIGVQKIAPTSSSSYKPNLLQDLERLIETHIAEPSEIRNKIAHGQWVIALNSENTRVNDQMTSKVRSIDCVDVMKWKQTYDHFYAIMNDIAQSPNKAHFRDRYTHLTNLQEYLKKSENFSLEGKIAALQKKRNRPKRKT